MKYEFEAELWEWQGKGAWHFISLPKEYANEIKAITESPIKTGFGSVRVSAKISKTTWITSIFPDNKSGSYLLPVKKDVRKKENLQAGSKLKVIIIIKVD
jgi:Domain of unknown function (DUF1905)